LRASDLSRLNLSGYAQCLIQQSSQSRSFVAKVTLPDSGRPFAILSEVGLNSFNTIYLMKPQKSATTDTTARRPYSNVNPPPLDTRQP
jgi:hypothetical protein